MINFVRSKVFSFWSLVQNHWCENITAFIIQKGLIILHNRFFALDFFCFEAEANKCSYQLRSSPRAEISTVQAPERKALRCYDAISSLFSQIMNPFCFQAGTTVGQQLITLCKASSRRPSALTKQQTAGQQRQPSNRSPGQLLTPALQTPPLA